MWIEYPALREAQYFLNSSTGIRFPLPPPLRLSAVQKWGSDSNTAPGSKVIARPRSLPRPLSTIHFSQGGPRSSNHDSRFTIHGRSSLSPTRRGRNAPVRARPPQFESRITIHDSRQFRAHPPGPSITAQAVLFCLETPASASRKRAVRPAHTGHNQTSRLPSQRKAYRHTGLSHEPATAPERSRFRARDREMC